MALCLSNCVTDIPARYDTADCLPVFRAFGFKRWLAFKCGISWTDIEDASEWGTKITAGDIVVAPGFGALTFGDTSTSLIADGCGISVDEFSETPWTFTTPSTVADYTDEDFWDLFNKSKQGYTIGHVSCDDRVYLNEAAVTTIKAGGEPIAYTLDVGFKMDIQSIPTWKEGPNGAGNAGIWEVSGLYKHQGVFRSVEIAGIGAVIE